jgi:hypothetical protein
MNASLLAFALLLPTVGLAADPNDTARELKISVLEHSLRGKARMIEEIKSGSLTVGEPGRTVSPSKLRLLKTNAKRLHGNLPFTKPEHLPHLTYPTWKLDKSAVSSRKPADIPLMLSGYLDNRNYC